MTANAGPTGPMGVAKPLARAAVAEQLRELGVREGDVLLVHASYSAVRPIQGGPEGLLAGLRQAVGPNGTLAMPSYTGDDDRPFDRDSTPAAPELGILADLFWRQPGVLRSDHPFAFAAAGPRAPEITTDPVAFPPHGRASPVGRVHEAGGKVLLLGVGHEANTTIHLAELLAGAPYRVARHITLLQNGRPLRVEYEENDHCCQRFALADNWLRARGAQAEGRVGYGTARLIRSREVVDAVTENLLDATCVLLHARGSGCRECEEAWESVRLPGSGS